MPLPKQVNGLNRDLSGLCCAMSRTRIYRSYIDLAVFQLPSDIHAYLRDTNNYLHNVVEFFDIYRIGRGIGNS